MSKNPTDFLKTLRRRAFSVIARSSYAVTRPQVVFLLGHVRSGSTLLTRILTTNSQIAGQQEMFIKYEAPKDVSALYVRLCRTESTPFLRSRYVLDQINHSKFLAVSTLAQLPVSRIVILIREPSRTLASMMHVFGPGGKKENVSLPQRKPGQPLTESEALSYYRERLAMLTTFAARYGGPSILVEYDRVVDSPEEVLAALTAFFDLGEPLAPVYRAPNDASNRSDPSGNIQAGRIVKTAAPDVHVSEGVLASARGAYLHARTSLRELCSSIA